MRSNFILILIGFLFLAALKWRFAGLVTYWWFGIFRPQEWIYLDVSGLRLPLVAAVLLIIPSIVQKKLPHLNNPIAKLMIFWWVTAVLANQINGCSNVVLENALINLGILIYIVLLSGTLVETRQKLFWLIVIVGFSLAFHSGKGGIYALVSGGLSTYGAENLGGMFSGSNAYALGSAILLFFMIFASQHLGSATLYNNFPGYLNNSYVHRGFKYLMLLLTFGTIYNVISLSSRGSSIAMFVAIFLWIYLQKKKVKIFALLIPVLIAGLMFVPLPEGYMDRITGVFVEPEYRDNSAASRPHFWQTAIKMSRSYPLGVGPGCYPAYYDRFDATDGFYGRRRSVHSSHLQILADSGYVGLILWVCLLLVAYAKLWRIRKIAQEKLDDHIDTRFYFNLSNCLICSQSAFIMGGAFYELAYNDITWLTFGLVIIIEKLQHNEINASKVSAQDDLPDT